MISTEIAVLIKTCYSRPSLLWVLKSIEHALRYENYRIYISDEKPLNEWKIPVYNNLDEQGHHVELHAQGISCGEARNKLIEKLQDENLILRMDDDFELGGEFNFEALKTVLESSNQIGFCSDFERQLGNSKGVRSGSIRPAGGTIKISPPIIIKKFHGPFQRFRREKGIRFTTAEFTRNLLLIKRKVLEDVKWNEDLLFRGEHLEFMLSIRKAGYKGAYTPDSIHYHRDDLSVYRKQINGIKEKKKQERPGGEIMEKVFKSKWGCDNVQTKYPYSWYLYEGWRRIFSK